MKEKKCYIPVVCEGLAIPSIGENGNWFIGDEDTGVSAQGMNGITPHVGDNGNWFLGEVDTEVKAQGMNGAPGPKGDQGISGPQGVPGQKGDKGDTGAKGESGTSVGFGAMDVVYKGIINIEGKTYQLDKPITNYSALIIEVGLYYKSEAYWGSFQYMLIPNPVTSPKLFQYSKIIWYDQVTKTDYGIGWSFNTNNTLTVSFAFSGKPTLNISDMGITKIYGIK